MTDYKATLKRRVVWSRVFCVVLLAMAVAAMIYGVGEIGEGDNEGYIRGMQAGILSGILATALFYAVRLGRVLKDEARIKKLYIWETDERNVFIQNKIGGRGINMTIVLLAMSGFVAGYFDRTVFFTLMGATVAVAFIKAGLKLYFYRKF